MRIKALIGLAVIAASAATCLAQGNVYSLNIVGYVNVPIQGGGKLTLVSNPLKPSNGNYNITNTVVLPDTQEGANLFAWAGTSWNSVTPQWYAGAGWFPDFNVGLGEAFFIQTPPTSTGATITFVGEVETSVTAPIAYTLNKGLNVVASKIPVEANFPGADVGNEGDNIYSWTGTAWDPITYQYYGTAFGWDNGTATANTNGPLVGVGGGIVYNNLGASAINWTRTFTP